jgi:hypothetical protein
VSDKPFREINPYVGTDATDEEIDAELEDDAEYLRRQLARRVPPEKWIPEQPFDSADYLDGLPWGPGTPD